MKSEAISERERGQSGPADDDPCFYSAGDLVAAYRSRKLSPSEVTEAFFARIDRINPVVNAYVTLARESALADARAATQSLRPGNALGPLRGVPVAIKDVTPTRGIRTTWGSKIYADHVPDEDALIVQRLKAAGAIVIGKTNTPEFAAGAHTFNALFGRTRNPWNVALSAGGSRGGAAVAVATGMSTLADGSDPAPCALRQHFAALSDFGARRGSFPPTPRSSHGISCRCRGRSLARWPISRAC